jgi:phage shock protein PspC (stress-responsive transcriptional regulator)
MTTMTLFADATPNRLNPNTGEPFVLGVCAEIAHSLHLPAGQVRMATAAAIIGSLVVPGLIAYAVLGLVFRSRRHFNKARPCNPALARANAVLEAYIHEKRNGRDA